MGIIFYLLSHYFSSKSVIPVEKLTGGGCTVISYHWRKFHWCWNIQSAEQILPSVYVQNFPEQHDLIGTPWHYLTFAIWQGNKWTWVSVFLFGELLKAWRKASHKNPKVCSLWSHCSPQMFNLCPLSQHSGNKRTKQTIWSWNCPSANRPSWQYSTFTRNLIQRRWFAPRGGLISLLIYICVTMKYKEAYHVSLLSERLLAYMFFFPIFTEIGCCCSQFKQM